MATIGAIIMVEHGLEKCTRAGHFVPHSHPHACPTGCGCSALHSTTASRNFLATPCVPSGNGRARHSGKRIGDEQTPHASRGLLVVALREVGAAEPLAEALALLLGGCGRTGWAALPRCEDLQHLGQQPLDALLLSRAADVIP